MIRHYKTHASPLITHIINKSIVKLYNVCSKMYNLVTKYVKKLHILVKILLY